MFAIDATVGELEKAIANCGVGHVSEGSRVEWVKYISLIAPPLSVTDTTAQYMGSLARSNPSMASGRLR